MLRRILIGLGAVVVLLAVLAAGAYAIWLYNPHNDRLVLDPSELFPPDHANRTLLLRDVKIVDLESGSVRPESQILIRGDSIVGITSGSSGRVVDAGQVIDGMGRWVMPGLIDLHVHLNTGGIAEREPDTVRFCLESFVRYGVTTVLWLGGFAGNDRQTAEAKKRQREHAIVSPILFGSGEIITIPGSHPISTLSQRRVGMTYEQMRESGVVAYTPDRDLRAIVDRKRTLGLDGVKIVIEDGPEPWYPKPRMSRETAREIVEAASAAGLPVFAHISGVDEMSDAIESGVVGIMHSAHDRLIDDPGLVSRMLERKVTYVPNLGIAFAPNLALDPIRLQEPFLRNGVSARALRSLENPLFRAMFLGQMEEFDSRGVLDRQLANLARLNRQGVRIGMGSDTSNLFAFPGYSAHVELEQMAAAGMSPIEVLRAATVNGARLLGAPDRLGSVRVGGTANLLLLDANPLEDVQNVRRIHSVILQGAVIDPVSDRTEAARGDRVHAAVLRGARTSRDLAMVGRASR